MITSTEKEQAMAQISKKPNLSSLYSKGASSTGNSTGSAQGITEVRGKNVIASCESIFSTTRGGRFQASRETARIERTSYRGNDGTIVSVSISAVPETLPKRIKRALEWTDEDDLLCSLLESKYDFTMAGFGLTSQPKGSISNGKSGAKKGSESSNPGGSGSAGGSGNTDDSADSQAVLTDKLSDFYREWDIWQVCYNLLTDWYATDNMILLWQVDTAATKTSSDSSTPPKSRGSSGNSSSAAGEDGEIEQVKYGIAPGLIDISALCPADVEWSNSLGVDVLKIKIPTDLVKRIADALNAPPEEQSDRVDQLVLDGVNEKYIEAVKKGDQYVRLRNEDGEYWAVATKARKHHGLAEPRMQTIFNALEARQSLCAGDFAAAFMTKHFILHITAGESIESGPFSGMRNNWATDAEIKKLNEEFATPSQAMRIATNHTVKFAFIYPPKEMFDPAKYHKTESRIHNHVGISEVMATGSGGSNYSGGYISIKRTTASISTARTNLRLLFEKCLNHPTIRGILSVPDTMNLTAVFDEQILKEPAQLLDEVNALVDEGILDPRTALQELGRDPDTVKANKERCLAEDESTSAWSAVSAVNQQAVDAANAEANAAALAAGSQGNPGGAGLKNGGSKQGTRSGKAKGGRPANPGTTKSEATRTQPPSTGR